MLQFPPTPPQLVSKREGHQDKQPRSNAGKGLQLRAAPLVSGAVVKGAALRKEWLGSNQQEGCTPFFKRANNHLGKHLASGMCSYWVGCPPLLILSNST